MARIANIRVRKIDLKDEWLQMVQAISREFETMTNTVVYCRC